MSKTLKHPYPAWAEVDRKAIRHNLRQIRKLAAQRQASSGTPSLLAVIKADAYGHGMRDLAKLLQGERVEFLGVSDVQEGVALRGAGIKSRIVLLEGCFPEQASEVIQCQLRPVVYAPDVLQALGTAAVRRKTVVPVHIKIDTGMRRLGVAMDDAETFIRKAAATPGIRVEGLLTHFPLADHDGAFTRGQLKRLETLIGRIAQTVKIPYVHAANSMGLAGYSSRVLNLARPGLLLYGLSPKPGLKRRLNLRPALSVKARVLQVKDIRKGEGISYGHSFKAPRSMTVATLPVGYSDGYFRHLSNTAHVLVKGKPCPVVGTVTMDQIMIDVSRVPAVRAGDVVTVLGEDRGRTVTADDIAAWAGTISYEVVCQLGNNLPRIMS